VFVVVPLVAVIGLLLTLFYVYSQLELPKTPPPLQTTHIYDREGNQIATLHSRWTGRSSRSRTCRCSSSTR
jgi:hypothetical protein